MTELQQMTANQLKQYLSEHRRDDDKFSAALSELLKRDPNPIIYPADMPLEAMEKIVQEKIKQIKKEE